MRFRECTVCGESIDIENEGYTFSNRSGAFWHQKCHDEAPEQYYPSELGFVKSGAKADNLVNGQSMIDMRIRFVFMDDVEWYDFMEYCIVKYDESPMEEFKLRAICSAYESNGYIYIREAVRKEPWFLTLIQHELGHAFCDFNHIDGVHLMNSYRPMWDLNTFITEAQELIDNIKVNQKDHLNSFSAWGKAGATKMMDLAHRNLKHLDDMLESWRPEGHLNWRFTKDEY